MTERQHSGDSRPLFGRRRSVKSERIGLGTEINREHHCHACDAKSVHWGEVRSYGFEVFVMGVAFFVPHGENVYCRECRDEIGHELRGGVVEKP